MMIVNCPKGTQILFMKLLVHLAKADEVISKEEETIIEEFSKALNIPWKDLNHEWDLKKILSPIKNSDGKIYFIVELMRLAFADGCYDNLEKDKILEISKIIQIPEEKTTKIEEWVKKEVALKKEFAELLET
jgi:uncharacterized tellurite resistance protein B-like protein